MWRHPPTARPGDPVSVLRVAIVEDQPLFRQLLTSLVASAATFVVHASVSSLTEARARIDPRQIDVALLDIGLPDGSGIDYGRELRRERPRLGIVLLSAVDRMDTLLDLPAAQHAGWSYLSKTSSLSARDLMLTLRAAAEGRSVLDRDLVARRRARTNTRLAALSPRQSHVLSLLAEGHTNAAIARELDVSPRSVENHVYAIYSTLGISRDDDRNARVLAARIYLAETR
ncbi:response regulator transcription factor [Agromyces atrinae]|uniref:Response regulator transcription factor n=1 Tax=Agromyces atrinae TaxID=592376 RepID=A0A4Q2M9Z6_9MICO|nr:response regulator transcription factor [Agromyces atrinae]